MTTVLDVVLIVAWISVVVFIGWQVTRKPASAARTGARGPRQRARSGNGGMSVRFTPPPRYVPDPNATPKPAPDRLADALAGLAPALLCTLCVVELKQARAGGEPDPEVHPGVVMGDVVVEGRPSTAVVCEVRHPLAVGAVAGRPLFAAPADA